MAEGGGLLNRCTGKPVPGVRIPHSPPFLLRIVQQRVVMKTRVTVLDLVRCTHTAQTRGDSCMVEKAMPSLSNGPKVHEQVQLDFVIEKVYGVGSIVPG